MSSKTGSGTGRKILITILIIAAVSAALVGYRMMHLKTVSNEAQAVLEQMKEVIPGLGDETHEESGEGKDPLPVMIINDIDIIGCIEAPSIDLMAPVTAKSEARDGFASYLDGSALKGKLRLSGKRDDVFSRITSLKPGDKVSFTDMDGVRYQYSVLTQFHLKKWDKADYDLMLCYKTDDITWFIVGMNRS